MRKSLLSLMACVFFCSSAIADDGIIRVKSSHDVKVTADRLVQVLNAKGMTVFIRIDHAEGAEKVGKKLRPTELVIFGNPKIGTPLMQCAQSIGMDLPQKALISEDESGQVWFSYNDPMYLAKRHNVNGCDEVLTKVSKALGKFSAKATSP